MTDWTDETGATAVEYGLVAGAVGVALVVMGPWLHQAFLVFFNIILDDMLKVS